MNKRCALCNKYNMFDSPKRTFYIQELSKSGKYNDNVLNELCIDCLSKEYEKYHKGELLIKYLGEDSVKNMAEVDEHISKEYGNSIDIEMIKKFF